MFLDNCFFFVLLTIPNSTLRSIDNSDKMKGNEFLLIGLTDVN